MARSEPLQGRAPVGRAAKIRDHDDERSLRRESPDEAEGVIEAAAAGRRAPQGAEREQQPAASLVSPDELLLPVAEDDHPEPVPAPRRKMADR